ncbi:MAG: peptidase C15 [Cyanobacteria bacterium J06621_12]
MNEPESSAQIKVLLTSFQTWLPHQKSNSSDDLLDTIQKSNCASIANLFLLRNLPVNVEKATYRVIKKVKQIEPEIIVCCGMAEKRNKLTIESNASHLDKRFYTSVNVADLVATLEITEVSNDAGKFVCEGLYYQLLKYIRAQSLNTQCIFVHVPLLSSNQSKLIRQDFDSIICKLIGKLNLDE